MGSWIQLRTAAGSVYRDGDLASRWSLCEKIGEGSFAVVRRAESLQHANVSAAVKVLPKRNDPSSKRMIMREIITYRTVASCDEPNIVSLFEISEDDENVYLVMELVRGADLGSVKKPVDEATCIQYAISMINALRLCHHLGVTHRDITPMNFMKNSNGDLKLMDFGVSFYDDQDSSETAIMSTQCGTPQYMSPEVIRGQPYDCKCDMWSVGAVIFELLTGHTPFKNADERQMLRDIRFGQVKYVPGEWGRYSEPCLAFVVRLLDKKPSNRMTASEALKHPWVFDQVAKLSRPVVPNKSNVLVKSSSEQTFKTRTHAQTEEDKKQACGVELATPHRRDGADQSDSQLLSIPGSKQAVDTLERVDVPHPGTDPIRMRQSIDFETCAADNDSLDVSGRVLATQNSTIDLQVDENVQQIALGIETVGRSNSPPGEMSTSANARRTAPSSSLNIDEIALPETSPYRSFNDPETALEQEESDQTPESRSFDYSSADVTSQDYSSGGCEGLPDVLPGVKRGVFGGPAVDGPPKILSELLSVSGGGVPDALVSAPLQEEDRYADTEISFDLTDNKEGESTATEIPARHFSESSGDVSLPSLEVMWKDKNRQALSIKECNAFTQKNKNGLVETSMLANFSPVSTDGLITEPSWELSAPKTQVDKGCVKATNAESTLEMHDPEPLVPLNRPDLDRKPGRGEEARNDFGVAEKSVIREDSMGHRKPKGFSRQMSDTRQFFVSKLQTSGEGGSETSWRGFSRIERGGQSKMQTSLSLRVSERAADGSPGMRMSGRALGPRSFSAVKWKPKAKEAEVPVVSKKPVPMKEPSAPSQRGHGEKSFQRVKAKIRKYTVGSKKSPFEDY